MDSSSRRSASWPIAGALVLVSIVVLAILLLPLGNSASSGSTAVEPAEAELAHETAEEIVPEALSASREPEGTDAPDGLQLVVLDRTGPVEGARIFTSPDSIEWTSRGLTDDGGELQAPVTILESPNWILAEGEARGACLFSPAQVARRVTPSPNSATGRELRLFLEPLQTVEIHVRNLAGRALDSKVEVRARWGREAQELARQQPDDPARRSLARRLAPEAQSSQLGVHTVRLDPTRPLRVIATAPGYVPRETTLAPDEAPGDVILSLPAVVASGFHMPRAIDGRPVHGPTFRMSSSSASDPPHVDLRTPLKPQTYQATMKTLAERIEHSAQVRWSFGIEQEGFSGRELRHFKVSPMLEERAPFPWDLPFVRADEIVEADVPHLFEAVNTETYGTLALTVVDSQGSPTRPRRLVLVSEPGSPRPRATVHAWHPEKEFSDARLPAGDYEIGSWKVDPRFGGEDEGEFETVPVTVIAQQHVQAEVRLRPVAQARYREIRVRDDAGRPLRGWSFVIVREGTWQGWRGTGPTRPSEPARLEEPTTPGPYAVVVHQEGYEPGVALFDVPGEPIELVLQASDEPTESAHEAWLRAHRLLESSAEGGSSD